MSTLTFDQITKEISFDTFLFCSKLYGKQSGNNEISINISNSPIQILTLRSVDCREVERLQCLASMLTIYFPTDDDKHYTYNQSWILLWRREM